MRIAIIGAGACGLMLAALLNKNNITCSIFNEGKIGNKILASGNGKCNISNKNYDSFKYHNNPLAHKIISNNKEELFSLFEELKIYTKSDDEGRMYPISESSLSVLNILLRNIKSEIIDVKITDIKKDNNKYYLNDIYGPFDYIILATGSIAGYKHNMEYYFKSLDIKFNEFYPSLVGFKTSLNIKPISGVRHKCLVSLYQNNNLIHSEKGEVIFKDNGISGICVMNLSSYYAHLANKHNCRVKIDLSPNNDYDDLTSILHPKLLEYVLKNKIDIHNMIINISGVYDFEFAQVCRGGIDISEVNNSLRLKKHRNVFVGGELLDCDGVCGGFNLMLAFCCAIQIFKELDYEISNR